MSLWIGLAYAMLLAGCQGPDPYYRIEKIAVCAFVPVERTECSNPACNICSDANGSVQAVYQADGCQIAGTVGVTLCVNDCSICDKTVDPDVQTE